MSKFEFNPVTSKLDLTGINSGDSVSGINSSSWLTTDSSGNLFGTKFWVDVKAYGATGNGTTDDTAAIQSAIDSLASTGGTVYFSDETYIITNITVNNPSIVLRGVSGGRSSRGSTLKAKSGATGAMVRIFGTSGGNNHCFRNGVYDLLITGNSQSVVGLQLDYLSLFRIENVEISGTADDGLKITQCFDSVFEQVIIRNINGTNKSAIRILSDSTDNSNNLRFNSVHLESNTDYDVIIDDAGSKTNNHIIFLDGKIEGGSGPQSHSVWIKGTKNDNIYFNFCRFTNYPNGSAIDWDSNGFGFFDGNVFTNSSTFTGTAIDLSAGAHDIRNNFFFGWTTDVTLPSDSNPQRHKISGNRKASADTSVKISGIDRNDDIYKANAAPTTGTWVRGSYVLDYSPTLGAIPGWACTTSGSPGTWAEFPPLLDASHNFLAPHWIGIGGITPVSQLHQDDGNATSTYHKFTAGTTTGQTSSDGFDVGIDSSGNAEVRQRENLPLKFYSNNKNNLTLGTSGQVTIGSGEAGVDYDFLKVDGESSDLTMKWWEDEQYLQINSNNNQLSMAFGNPSTDLVNYLAIFQLVGINGAGFSSENEAAFFLESKGDSTVFGGSVFAGLYNDGSVATKDRLLAGFWGGGYASSGNIPTAAQINMYASEDFTSTSSPSYISFKTTPNGSTSVYNEAMRITDYTRVQIGDQTYLSNPPSAYNSSYGFFPTPDTKFQVTGQVTSIGTSFSPFDILKLVNTTSFNFNPSADTNSGLGATVYGGAGFNAFATGTHSMNGGLDIGAETVSIIGAFGQFANKQTSTNTLDGAVGVLFTAAHYGYGGVGNKIFGAIFNAETSDDAGNGSVSGSQTYLAAAKFLTRVSGVNVTTGVGVTIPEPYAYDQGTGVGTPTLTNRTAIDLQGTISLKDSDVATAASITNMAVATSAIRLTGSTATDLHGIHADTFNKMIWIYNVSSATVTLKHQSGSEGTAANRIICNTGADVAITTGKSVCLWYDDNQSRWIHLINS